LNEVGLDPGIDHMSAMRLIHGVREQGGTVKTFRSLAGALPAFESNNNPFGYKFTWSPKGVLQASKSSARWLADGKEMNRPGDVLFEGYDIIDIPGVGAFEHYPNRDSLPYRDAYGLELAQTVYRGTLRNTGWCETMRSLVALGWLSEDSPEDFAGGKYGDLTRHLIGADSADYLPAATAKFLGVPEYAAAVKRLGWLGIFDDAALPEDAGCPLDCLHRLALVKLSLGPDERDMVVMHHELTADMPDGRRHIRATLVDIGEGGYYTAIARTVGLPAAMAVKQILEGAIAEVGVHLPILPAIYDPILDELESVGIRFDESISAVGESAD
jgi:saccharopine dehydrogenase-like NADP-dependent oxidoreductase